MRILALSDTHGVIEIPEGNFDLVLLLGDIEYGELRKIDQMFSCPKVGVLGNHDAPDYFNGTSIINVHSQVLDILGLKIAGFEGVPRYNKRTYLQYEEIDAFLFTTSIPKVDIFIAHANPMWDTSVADNDPHRGFLAYADYIEQMQPKYFLHGHIHQEKKYKIENTNVISVYPFLMFDY